jgi:predicted transcriptional regulator of viral defense system
MSTELLNKHNKNAHLSRFADLAKLGEMLFHADDLANLWGIANKNTLHVTLKRYVDQGLFFRIYKGFYSLKPLSQVDPLLLGQKALHGYAYISTETVLSENGIIGQSQNAITLVSQHTKHFSIGTNRYLSRTLADKFLYQNSGIISKENGLRKASVPRAVADLLYFNPHAHLDGANLIDWEKVRELQKELGYPLTVKYQKL